MCGRSSKSISHTTMPSTRVMQFSFFHLRCTVAWKYAIAFRTPCGTRVGVNSLFSVAIMKISRAFLPMETANSLAADPTSPMHSPPPNRSTCASRSAITSGTFCIYLFTTWQSLTRQPPCFFVTNITGLACTSCICRTTDLIPISKVVHVVNYAVFSLE